MEATLNKNEKLYLEICEKNLEISWNFVIVENGNPETVWLYEIFIQEELFVQY